MASIAGIVLGALFSTLTGFVLYYHNRSRSAKDAFLIVISHTRVHIDSENVMGYYLKTKPAVQESVSRVLPFLRRSCAINMQEAWGRYDWMDYKKELNQDNEGEFIQHIFVAVKTGEVAPNKPTSFLKSKLDAMSDIAI